MQLSDVPKEDYNSLVKAIEESCHIDPSLTAKDVANDMIKTEKVRDAAFGSLIKFHHAAGTGKLERYDAIIPNYVARVNTAWNYYGGTVEFPMLMQGAERKEGEALPCVVTEKSLIDASGKLSISDTIKFIKSFNERENRPGNLIYRLKFMKAQPVAQGAEPVLTMTCKTDSDGLLYVGDALTLEEKAMIGISEWGDERYRGADGIADPNSNIMPHHQTFYNYLIETVDAFYKKGFPVSDEFTRMIKAMNYLRSQMPKDERVFLAIKESRMLDHRNGDFLRNLEKVVASLKGSNSGDLTVVFQSLQQQGRNLDPRVFESAGGPELTKEQFHVLQHKDRNKLRKILDMKPLAPLSEEYPYDFELGDLDYSGVKAPSNVHGLFLEN